MEGPREKQSKPGDSSAASEASKQQESQAKIDSAKMLSNADLISRGMSKQCFGDARSGQSFLKEGQGKLAGFVKPAFFAEKVLNLSCRLLLGL